MRNSFRLQKAPFIGEEIQTHRENLARFIRDLCTHSSEIVNYILCGEDVCRLFLMSSIFVRQNEIINSLTNTPVFGFLAPSTIDEKEACPTIIKTSLCKSNEFFLMPKIKQPTTIEEIEDNYIMMGVLV